MRRLLPLLLLLIWACTEEDTVPDIAACAYQSAGDTSAIAAALLGTWEWQYAAGGRTGYTSTELGKGIALVFTADRRLEVYRTDSLLVATTWQLETVGPFDTYLRTGEFLEWTQGPVQHCPPDRLRFFAGALDGVSHYYLKQ